MPKSDSSAVRSTTPRRKRQDTRALGREPLTRERVLESALSILNEKGVAALTFRSLADDLRVTPMALYRHVASKVDLLNGIVDLVVRKARVTAHEDERWEDWISTTFVAIRESMIARPGVLPLLGSVPVLGPDSLQVMEKVLSVLRVEAQLSEIGAARAFHRLMAYTLGSVAMQGPTIALMHGVESRSELLRRLRAGLESLPDAQFPTLVALATEMSFMFKEEEFKSGLLELILSLNTDGVTSAGTRRRKKRHP